MHTSLGPLASAFLYSQYPVSPQGGLPGTLCLHAENPRTFPAIFKVYMTILSLRPRAATSPRYINPMMRLVMSVLIAVFAAPVAAAAANEPWVEMEAFPKAVEESTPWVRPQIGKPLQLDLQALRISLAAIPMEVYPIPDDEGVQFSLPHPDGGFARFRIVESPIMEPELAAKFPEIKTYRGQGVDDPAANLRMDVTPLGFHAMVLSPEGDYYIDPYSKDDVTHYTAYYKRNFMKRGIDRFFCATDGEGQTVSTNPYGERASGATLRTYRLAVAATGEYTAFFGGTVAAGQAAIVTAVNRVTGLYERDLCIRFTLVANNNLIVYTNSATDPYTNNNGGALLGENQNNITSIIGTANYDIGHVFSTGGGGVAGLGVVCNSTNKARGVTGQGSPTGDPFYIDYVAHEIGHQFGGGHTFNGTGGACSGNRSSTSAYEPGSASSIMGYAGICSADNIQSNSDVAFHGHSYAQIRSFITSGGGASCGVNSATGNTQPTVNGGADFTIPLNTPFTVTPSTSGDANGDSLTYSWEQMDLGAAQTLATADNGTSPIFRTFTPSSSSSRTFPRYSNILSNTLPTGEKYPVVARTLDLRINVRDNRSGGGGVIEDNIVVNINGSAGPFQVTAPNTNVSWVAGAQTVTWNVANTTAAPVNTANVRILLSADGGNTFPYTLLATTPNDGSQSVTIPDVNTTQARIRIEAVGNIYFDISNVNFTITGTPPPATPTNVSVTPSSFCATGTQVTLTGTVGSGETIDWYTSTCGGTLIGSGSPLNVTANATTQYFARARRTTGGAVSNSCASATATLSAGSVPAPATVAAADGASCSTVSVTWSSVSGATSYQIWRNTVNNSGTATQIATDTASPYSDATAVIGTGYFYWIKSVGPCGASAFSAGDAGSLRFPLDPPTGQSATGGCSGSVVLAWNAVAASSGYQVFRNTINDSNSATLVAGTLNLTLTDSSPPANVTLYYWVRTLTACGPGPSGAALTAVAGTAPGIPLNMAATDALCDRVTLSWGASANAATYDLLRNTVNNAGTAALLANTANVTFDDTTAVPGTLYYYFVRAVNSCGQSNATAGVSGSRPAAQLPVPGGLAAAGSCDNILISWNMAPGALGYQILRGVNADGSDLALLTSTANITYIDVTAIGGTTYYYAVRSTSVCGQSPLTPIASAARSVAPTTPTGVVATNNDCAKIVVTWSASSGATSYEVLRAPASSPLDRAIIGTTTATLWEDASALATVDYVYSVRALGACENPSLSQGAAGVRPAILAPTGLVAADGTSCSGVLLTWSPVAGAQSYDVWRNISNTPVGATLLVNTANVTFDDTTAGAGITYYYFVSSVSAGCGTSQPSVGDAGFAGTSPTIGQQPQDQNVNEGDGATLTVVASGNSVTYVWFKDNSPVVADPPRLTGEQSAGLTFTQVLASDSGEYFVRVTNECGTVDSEVAVLTVGEPYCPADFNLDGGVDGVDVEVFFDAWSAADPSADVNFDGGVDGADVEVFFSAWSAGGC